MRASLLSVVLLSACSPPAQPPPRTNPQRVLSQTVLSDEVLWDFGRETQAKVVGVSKMADDEEYSGVARRWPPDVPRVPGTSEALLAARPELAIVAEFTAAETLAILHASHIDTLVLRGFTGFADYERHLREIGEAVGARARAETMVAELRAELAALAVPAGDPPTILSFTSGTTPGQGTSFGEIATLAGFRNLPSMHGVRGHQVASLEQVLAWDPEYVVTSCGRGACAEAEALLAEQLAPTRAARNHRIRALPSRTLFSSGAGMLELLHGLVALRSHESQ